MTAVESGPARGDGHARRELLAKAAEGSADALADLLVDIRPGLLQRIRLMMGAQARRVADSGDFLGSLMLDLLREFRDRGIPQDLDIIRWATCVARNNIRDSVRKRHERRLADFSSSFRLRKGPVDSGPQPDDAATVDEQVELMLDSLESLPDHWRQVIELRDLRGLSYEDVATHMRRGGANAARKLHARALGRLSQIVVARSK